MSKAKTNKYIVTKMGVCLKGIVEEEVGAKVSLTDEKAAGMVGKVRLLKDYENDSRAENELAEANAKIKELTKQVEDLTAALSAPAKKK